MKNIPNLEEFLNESDLNEKIYPSDVKDRFLKPLQKDINALVIELQIYSKEDVTKFLKDKFDEMLKNSFQNYR